MTRSSSLERYVAALPQGLASYPGCQQKAQILRQFVTGANAAELFDRLPHDLADLARHPPPVTEWVPEVHATAIYLALRDVLGSDEQFFQHCYAMNKRLLSSPLYRVLFAVASPARMLRGASERWGKLHRGTELRARRVDAYDAEVRLTAPAQLIPALLGRAYATAYQVAVELAGGQDVAVSCIELADGARSASVDPQQPRVGGLAPSTESRDADDAAKREPAGPPSSGWTVLTYRVTWR